MKIMTNFLRDEQGQDLIEYTLLLAFVALASAALFIGAGGSIKGIWSTSNSQLAAANSGSLLAGLVSRKSSTCSTRPTPKKFAHTRLVMARLK